MFRGSNVVQLKRLHVAVFGHLAILAATLSAISHKLAKRLGHELLVRCLGRTQRDPSFRLQMIQQATHTQIPFKHDSICCRNRATLVLLSQLRDTPSRLLREAPAQDRRRYVRRKFATIRRENFRQDV